MSQGTKGLPSMSGHPDICGRCGEQVDGCLCGLTYATHQDLRDETAAVRKHVARQAEITRDQLYHLHETHTVARMAAELYGKTTEHPHVVAKDLYRKVQKSLERDRTIVGAIPAA